MTPAGFTAILLTGALLVSADTPGVFFDAICGAPALRLPISPDLESNGVLEASEDLQGLEWRPLLQLSPGQGHHDSVPARVASTGCRAFPGFLFRRRPISG